MACGADRLREFRWKECAMVFQSALNALNPVMRISNEGKVLYANEPSAALLSGWDGIVGHAAPALWRKLADLRIASRHYLDDLARAADDASLG